MTEAKNVLYTRVLNAVAAGTGDTQAGTAVDMTNYDRVRFVVAIGAITSTGTATVKAQAGAASDGSDAADITGASVAYTDADDNKIAIVEVERPQSRYVRVVVVRATANVVIDGAVAIQAAGRNMPVTQGATVKGVATVQPTA